MTAESVPVDGGPARPVVSRSAGGLRIECTLSGGIRVAAVVPWTEIEIDDAELSRTVGVARVTSHTRGHNVGAFPGGGTRQMLWVVDRWTLAEPPPCATALDVNAVVVIAHPDGTVTVPSAEIGGAHGR